VPHSVPDSANPAALAERVLAGDPRSMARAISLIEDEHPSSADLVRAIFEHTGRAYLVGVTGPPGAGKSTLVDRLIAELRRQRTTVGVIAVDPTSPFTGGAVLGDRVRMQTHASDPGVFIRSMATRGHLGGLSRATNDAALVLDAAGKEVIIIETVGVGQDEVDIIRTADISIVTLVPGTGDEVQALKAGIMEIADIFVVNKADRDGADRLVAAIEANLALQGYAPDRWRPPVLKTVATSGAGVSELLATAWRFREWAREAHGPGTEPLPSLSSGAGSTAQSTAAQRREARSEHRLRELVSQRFMENLERDHLAPRELATVAAAIAAREIDPYTAANNLVRRGTEAASSQRYPVTPSPHYPVRPLPRLDHIGIAVKDLPAVLSFYRDGLGLEIEGSEEVPSQHVRAHFLSAGEARLELLDATSPESPIAKYLEKRGPGLHHLTLLVSDIEGAIAHLRSRNVRLIDERPRPGAEGALIAFVHPAATGGVLIELKQSRSAAHDRPAGGQDPLQKDINEMRRQGPAQ
jgi:LAO/AO transport system kinase